MLDSEKKIVYKKSPYWRISENSDGFLSVHAGADETYIIDDLEKEDQELIFNCFEKNNFTPILGDMKESVQKVFQKLVMAGVVVLGEGEKKDAALRVAVVYCGGQESTFLKECSEIKITDQENAEIVVVLRLGGLLKDAALDSRTINLPHLFVDVAYHHMLSIGPMVFPGETACVNCLVGRVAERWGDEETPEYSRSGSHAEIISAILLERLREYKERRTMPMLINNIWSFDIDKLTARYDPVFRLPWCTRCFPDVSMQRGGSFELPWMSRKEFPKKYNDKS